MLVGRSTELGTMAAALARASAGVTTLVVIEGEAGLGKTTLVSAVAEQARQLGFTTRSGFCDELESDRPFGALLSALAVSRRSVSMDPARRDLIDLLGSTPDLASPIPMAATPDLRTRMIDSICGLVEIEALDHPLALLIEDLHWADPSTILALRSVARRVEGYRLLIVATSRPRQMAQQRERDALWDVASERIVLRPLGAEDVLAVAESRLAAAPGPRLRTFCAGAGGNPLLLRELLDGVRDGLVEAEGVVELGDGVPFTFAAGIQRRVDSLSPQTAELVHVASVLTGPLDLDDVAALLGRPVARLVPTLREAVRSGLFVDDDSLIGFRHDLIRAAVLETVPGAVRRMLHREAARVLIDRGAPAALVVAHLDAARLDAEDAGELRTWLLRAAREAMGRAPSVAHTLLDRARSTLADDDAEAIAIAVEQLEAAVNAGLLREAIELGTALVARPLLEPHWARVRWWLGGALFLSQRAQEAAELFEAAGEATTDRDTRALLLAYATMARLATFSPNVEELLDRAIAAADASGDVQARTLSNGMMSRTLGTRLRLSETVAPAMRAAEIADGDPQGVAHRYQPQFFLALALLDNGRMDEALQASRRGRRQAEIIGAAWAEALFHGLDALIHYFSGQWDEAEVEAAAGIAAADETGAVIAVLWCHAIVALVALEAGDLERAEAAVEAGEQAFAAGQAQLGIDLVTLARGRVMMSRGDVPAALEHFIGCWDLFGVLCADVCQERLALALVDAAVLAAEPDRAAVVLVQTATWSAADPSARLAATAAACAARVDGDPVRLGAAARAASDAGMECDARALTAMAACALPAAEVRAEAAPDETAEDGWRPLSQAERRVCLAIARGLSNKAIAHELVLSPRTVETHVTRILRKLGLDSRLQIGLFVAAQGSVPSS